MRRIDDAELTVLPPSKSVLLVCFSHLRWNFVWQRPQHLLSRAAEFFETVFIEEPVLKAKVKPKLEWRLDPSGVRIGVPVLPEGCTTSAATIMLRRLLNGFLRGRDQQTLAFWYYTPMALPFTRHVAPAICIYDNMDELSAFSGAPPRLITLERELLERADVVFTGGLSLYEAKRSRHRNIHPIPSSIDASHFRKARQHRQEPPDQISIGHPRLGFFGVIDERFDCHLLARAAELRPDWQFVMIGPVVKIDPASLPKGLNIHWLGGKSYEALPHYLASWDIGIMPFALNESTRYISPTKTPEFLAAGVPVISTAITDVIRPYGQAGLVQIANSAEDLVNEAGQMLCRPREPWLRSVDNHLAGMSWDRTWSTINREIEKVLERRNARRLITLNREEAHV